MAYSLPSMQCLCIKKGGSDIEYRSPNLVENITIWGLWVTLEISTSSIAIFPIISQMINIVISNAKYRGFFFSKYRVSDFQKSQYRVSQITPSRGIMSLITKDSSVVRYGSESSPVSIDDDALSKSNLMIQYCFPSRDNLIRAAWQWLPCISQKCWKARLHN